LCKITGDNRIVFALEESCPNLVVSYLAVADCDYSRVLAVGRAVA
jgi:hypothetical protein